MSDNVIKEFLVGLNWKIDQGGEKRFHDSIRSATLQAKLLGDTIELALKKLLSVTTQVAETFDKMFYASSRINASVANIKSFETAVSMLGGTLEGAHQSLENFGRFLRVQPGGANFIESLGVSLRKTNGELKDTTELVEDLVKASKGKSYGVQMKIAEMLGIDENTWRAAMNGDLTKIKGQTRDIYNKLGLDLDKAAKDGREFANQMRQLQTTLGAITDKVVANLLGADGKGPLAQLTDWVNANGDTIARVLTSVALALGELVKALVKWLDGIRPEDMKKVTDWFSNMEKMVPKAQGALEKFAVFIAGAWVLSILAAFAKVRFGWLGLLALMLSAGDVDKDGKLHPTFNPSGPGGDPDLNGAGRMGDWMREKWNNRPKWLGGNNQPDAGNTPSPLGRQRAGAGGQYSASDVAKIVRRNGGTESEAAYLGAIAMAESRGNPRAYNPKGRDLSYGLFQINMLGGMGPERRKKYGLQSNEDLYDPDVAAKVAIRMHREARGYRDWSTYSDGKYAPYVAGAIRGSREYDDSKKNPLAESMKKVLVPPSGIPALGGARDPADIQKRMEAPPSIKPQAWNSSQEINQSVHTTIYGAGDAQAAASEINLAHARANRQLANMIRNTNGAAA